ncbi:DUF4126 family protein [Mucilaginibacter segetis]|uniref:DUF4126 family protein n=1 Tax=Mucilaginibacter segetis TaxID=2793071 RepID=A0A934UN06_9SPHI|nr:DUF4126 family protein [Mucilaginibacter segetis]MBK0379416.1 DUF4126 family protein [Mucilaginibacter segetis]
MEFKITDATIQTILLGSMAGMRTMYAPAVISHILSRHPDKNIQDSDLSFLQSITTSKILKVLALGELIGDKLPQTPARIKPISVTARLLSGLLVGSSIYKSKGKNKLGGASIAAVAALVSTFSIYFLRKAIGKNTRIPDPFIGAIEDALVIYLGIELTRVYNSTL